MAQDWISQNSQQLIAQIDRFTAAFATPATAGLSATQAAAGLSAAQVTALNAARTTLSAALTNRAAA